MDFGLTEEQQAIKDSAARFARERLAPHYQAREKIGRMEPELLQEMGSLGLIGCDLPEAYGGMGLDCLTSGILTEAIAYGDFNVSYIQLLASLLGGIVAQYGSEEQRQAWLPGLVSGEKMIALGLTEPGAGSDAANLQLKAERQGDDYILNGEKTSISLADQADVMVLFARTGPGDSRAKGVTAFLVPLDLPGITRTHFDDLGSLIVGRGSVFFEDVRIPDSWMMGEENRGFSQIMIGFDYSRAMIALQCIAAAQASVDETWVHVNDRQAFGGSLARNQGVTFPLAEAETYLEAARQICYRTLWLKDVGQPHTAEAAMCKWWSPKMSVDVIHDCLLLHGHTGWDKGMPFQQRMRDVMGLEIGDGTSQIMKMIIGREKLGRVALPHA
ncbi:MAG: acyl-CoA dehydrogenase family protein [Gammaproteobacteria bacterium]|nr:acyl-CoA dehydrogenase family protein [Gammaproteobacteria bacterium]